MPAFTRSYLYRPLAAVPAALISEEVLAFSPAVRWELDLRLYAEDCAAV